MSRRESVDQAARIDRMVDEARALPNGPTRVELSEEAVRLADLHNLDLLSLRTRENLLDAAVYGGRPDLLIVTYAWCLARFDKDPASYSAHSLLWRMKWVIGALPQFPEVELATLERMFADMERRFREHDGSIQPVLRKRRDVALQLGDKDAAAEYHRQLRHTPRSTLSDCPACEWSSRASYYLSTGKNARGVREIEALLASGSRCATIPDGIYSDVLVPLVRLKRAAEGMPYHKLGYPKVSNNVAFLGDWSAHLAFLALTDNLNRAVKLLERHLPAVESAHSPVLQLSFLRSFLLLVEILAERKAKMRLRLPAGSPFADPGGRYDLADLAGKLRARALELSAAYDRRNGNDFHQGLVKKLAGLRKLVIKVPYSG